MKRTRGGEMNAECRSATNHFRSDPTKRFGADFPAHEVVGGLGVDDSERFGRTGASGVDQAGSRRRRLGTAYGN
ncbi:hypothetical protein CULT_150085 [[Clostridium] ultunense Esp]|nr:hypothetical protein CULT_150085 [[Clostridium] ultunense Esp]